MGLLTDPSAGQSKIIKALIRHYHKLCVLLYIFGVLYFCSLAFRGFNGGTYFSENALLPALVRSEFKAESLARTYYGELLDEMEKYENTLPYPWLLAKFRQIGLDTYTHNFTLNYPLGESQTFIGKNVYGILRAPRAASTEALVLSVPYRTPLSVHQTTAPSIAIMLAFANFANKQKYWAKDIIFLVTEHEQLGVQAWLEAYHGVSCGKKGTLLAGDMRGRAGAIQAAINLELHGSDIEHIDIKIEGLNGQLPNLDLFNLVAHMCINEGMPHTFKNRFSKRFQDPIKDWKYSFQTMLAMVATQATGVPNGNHGLFYRFGIQALTIEGFSPKVRSRFGFLTSGRILEGTFRSLNNLLERFHQSFFFYLLSSSDRYISIGLYMPAICALAATLFIKSYAKWCQLHKDSTGEGDQNETSEETEQTEPDPEPFLEELTMAEWQKKFDEETSKLTNVTGINYGHIGLVFILAHIAGFMAKELPQHFSSIGLSYGYSTDTSIYFGFGLVSLLMMLVPIFIKKPDYESLIILNVLALLELGTALICISMYNISLAMFLAMLYAPFACLISPTRCRLCSLFQKSCWVLLHPHSLITIVVITYTFITFPNESCKEILFRGIAATKQAFVYGIVDFMIYGNWLFGVTCMVFISNWFCFWYMSWYRPSVEEVTSKTEKIKTD